MENVILNVLSSMSSARESETERERERERQGLRLLRDMNSSICFFPCISSPFDISVTFHKDSLLCQQIDLILSCLYLDTGISVSKQVPTL